MGALQFADDLVGRPSPKLKTRMDATERIPMEEMEWNAEMTEMGVAKKGKLMNFRINLRRNKRYCK